MQQKGRLNVLLNYENIVKEKMSKKRFIHSLNVSKVAKKLAQAYGADEKKAEIAGLLHDITKEMPEDEQLKLFESEGIILDDVERSTNKLWHSISGTIYVKKYLNIQEYIATSKNKEIIIDGKVIHLDDFICAEEVMLSGCVDEVIGYNSTAIGWALLIGNIKITCYESTALNRQYGFFNGSLTRKTLKKCGVRLLTECKYMIN